MEDVKKMMEQREQNYSGGEQNDGGRELNGGRQEQNGGGGRVNCSGGEQNGGGRELNGKRGEANGGIRDQRRILRNKLEISCMGIGKKSNSKK